MNTRQLLKVLMKACGQNPNSLAAALQGQVKQPQIHKFIEGVTREPRRSTLLPIARYYRVSIDAFFDEDIALHVLREIEDGTFVVGRAGGRQPASGGGSAHGVAGTSDDCAAALQVLASRIDSIDDVAQRSLIGARLQVLALAPDSVKARNDVLAVLL